MLMSPTPNAVDTYHVAHSFTLVEVYASRDLTCPLSLPFSVFMKIISCQTMTTLTCITIWPAPDRAGASDHSFSSQDTARSHCLSLSATNVRLEARYRSQLCIFYRSFSLGCSTRSE